MGRAPCCEKMGLKKGPWTPEEDRILIDYINSYGHANWRALPKLAGLLRCGKSCRLRWTNYLRPDIKRGNFTREEEDSIINLHQNLGNRWSAIAARLPGRTDNEIKNVWHTHLKKRLPQNQQQSHHTLRKPKQTKLDLDHDAAASKQEQQQCSSDVSTLTTTSRDNTINNKNNDNDNEKVDCSENDLALDEDFWSEVLSADNSADKISRDFNSATTTSNNNYGAEQDQLEFLFSPLVNEEEASSMCGGDDGMDFWYDVYARAEELTELLEL